MAQEKEIKNFVFNYTDGTSKTVEKGFFCKIKDEPNGEATLSFEMVGVSGKDLAQIVLGLRRVGRTPGNVRQKGK